MPKACPQCGSRKWRKDRVTGNAVCEDGHVFQDFRSENLVAEPTGTALQKRHVRRGPRVKKVKASDPNPDLYHGADADWLKVQGFQLMLRAQVQALSKLWCLPDVFEMIVRDLWAYHLLQVQLPHAPGTDREQRGFETMDPEADMQKDDDILELEKDGGSEKEDEKSGSGSESPDDGLDSDLLEQISQRSSSSTSSASRRAAASTARRKTAIKRELHASSTLVCLILGLWTIRYPIINADIEMLVNRVRIPFIDFGRSSHVPEEMRKHIDRTTMIALCPTRCLTPLVLHTHCRKMARYLQLQHQITIPEINLPSIGWKIVSKMGGSPTTYDQVMRLLLLVDTNLSLHDTDTKVVRYTRNGLDGSGMDDELGSWRRVKTTRKEDVWLPEVSVAAAWVVLSKMAYGLDGRERAPLVIDDPVVGMIKPEALIAELSRRLEGGTLNESHEDLGPQDFERLDSAQLDQFLDRCEEVLLSNRPLLNDPMFPLPATSATPSTSQDRNGRWRDLYSATEIINHRTIPADTPNKDLPLLPGEAVRSYNSRDVTGTLPTSYEIALRTAAEVAGVREQDMARLVELIEIKLSKAKVKRRNSNASDTRSRPNSRPGSRPNSRPPSRSGSAAPSRAASMSRASRRKSALVG